MLMQRQEFAGMNLGKASRPRWELTASAFDRLLASLDIEREKAAEKYLRLKNNLVRFFEARGIAAADDAADEVLDRLARKLDGIETIDDPQTYALGIARLVALEFYKRLKMVSAADTDGATIADRVADRESGDEREERLKCLDDCLTNLTAEKREIIVGYYNGEKRDKIENRSRLAAALGIPSGALRSRATRLRDVLENCIVDCLAGK